MSRLIAAVIVFTMIGSASSAFACTGAKAADNKSQSSQKSKS